MILLLSERKKELRAALAGLICSLMGLNLPLWSRLGNGSPDTGTESRIQDRFAAMAEPELIAEYWKTLWDVDKIEKAEMAEFNRIWLDRMNELNQEIFKLQDQERMAFSKAMSERIADYEAVKLLESRGLVKPEIAELILGTKERIQAEEARVNEELRGLRERIRQLQTVRESGKNTSA